MSDPKPCPFCGGEARLLLNAKRKIYGKDEYRTGVIACCNVCEARMFYGSEKLAIEAWNRRVQSERKTGKWIDDIDDPNSVTTQNYGAYCSVCETMSDYLTDYCGSCGADMRGTWNETD